jgi:Ig-like domain CHU_C associated/SprB repeat/Putative metal-binding motif/MAM domain, meprin/A5/mu/Proprotein convertase P-domain
VLIIRKLAQPMIRHVLQATQKIRHIAQIGVVWVSIVTSCSAQTCPTPTLLTPLSATDSTATFTWADVGDAYELEIRPVGTAFSGVPTHSSPADPPFEAIGLTPGVQYRAQVRTVCAATSSTSGWSTPRLFITDLNNARPCPLDLPVRDTSCAGGGQFFRLHVRQAPGTALGTDVRLVGVRLMLEHPWRSDLTLWLIAPDGTRRQLVAGLNAGDQNLGDPNGPNGCAQFAYLTDDAAAPALSTAAERDNITGTWRTTQPFSDFHNGQSPLGIWRIEVCDSKANHIGRLRLAQLVFEPTGCLRPPAPFVGSVSLTEATLTWSPPDLGGMDTVEITYGRSGFLPGTSAAAGALLTTADVGNTLITNGLQPLEGHQAYLRRRCASGLWSGYSAPAEFFTVCPATMSESFDTLATCTTNCTDPCPLPNLWQNISADDFEWKVRTGTGLTYPIAGPPSASGGSGRYLFFRNSCTPGGANGRKAIVRTRCVEVVAPAGPPCHFSLDIYMNTKTGSMSTLALQASTDGGLTWATVQTWTGNRGKRWRREFVNLAAYHGQTALFQLVATGTLGAYGDIAVDNLVFYGSQPSSTPDYTYYRDADGDGYGLTNQPFVTCAATTPVGYATQPGDCNDLVAAINPGAPESRCNGLDDNCNGPTDDTFVAAPQAQVPARVCEGTSVTWTAASAPVGQFYWFSAPVGGTLIGVGGSVTIPQLDQTTTLWLLDSIAASGGGCASQRTSATTTVDATPDLLLGAAPSLCAGDTQPLADVQWADLDGLTGAVTWHTAASATNADLLNATSVNPATSTTYWLKKTTPDGCFDVLEVPLTVHPRPAVSIINGDSIALCKNRSIIASAVATSGTGPMTWAWNSGENFNVKTLTANGISGQTTTYAVTATDANGCSATDQIKITTLPSVTQTNVTAITAATFCGGNDGQIGLQVLDGVAPYTVAWSGPQAGSISNSTAAVSIGNLTQGGYRITITDASSAGCSMVLPTLVINAPGLTVQPPVLTQPLCAGATGAIALTVIGSNPTYAWSDNGPATSTRTGLPSGVYTVTITDGACVQVLADLPLTAPQPLQVIDNQRDQISCFGAADGVIEVLATGGTRPYAYTWSDMGVSVALRENLAPGSYAVTVTDANGCSVVSPVWILTQPDVLDILPQVVPVTCNGRADGAIALSVAGGTMPYEVEWFDGQFLSDRTSLTAGSYTVTITDANGCAATRVIPVNEPNLLTINLLDLTQPICVGKPSGRIEVVGAGGNPPYQYQWQNGLQAPLLTNQPAGLYAVTVTDLKGCTATLTAAMTAAQLLSISLDSIRDVRCFGDQSGYLAVTVGGAIGAPAFFWNNLPGTSTQTSLAAGQYDLLVSDDRGCSIRDTFVIGSPVAALLPAVQAIVAVACAGDPTGQIEVATSGGSVPYQFAWTDGITTEDRAGLRANTYQLTVTDAVGCTAMTAPITITEPAALVVVPEVQSIPCFGVATGRIDLSVSGGTGSTYQYQWSHGPISSSVFALSAGAYSVTVTDVAGCVQEMNGLEVLALSQNFNVQIIDNQSVSCNSTNDGRLTAQVLNGTPPYQFAWSAPVGLHPQVQSATDVATNLSGGFYGLTVTDAAGCFKSIQATLVEESPPLAYVVGNLEHVVCKGSSTGAVPVRVGGGVPAYQLLWSNGATTANLQQVPAGDYQLTITDQRGCTTVTPLIEVEEPAIGLTNTVEAIVQDDCNTGLGSIQLSASGGYAPYQYLWSTGATTGDLVGLATGTYTLTTTDSEGCTAIQAWQINALAAPLEVVSYTIDSVKCFGTASGAIALGVSGGTAPLQYFWNNGLSGPNIAQLPPGTYRVTITDASGCTMTYTPPAVTGPSSPLDATWTRDSLATGWHVVLAPTGGWGGYSALWSDGGTGLDRLNLPGPTFYDVTLTDAMGCTKVLSIRVGTSSAFAPEIALEVAVWPNPAHEFVQIQVDEAVAARPWRVRVVNLFGVEMLTAALTSGTEQTSLGLETLPAGVYGIIVDAAGGTSAVFRFVKQ